MTENEANLEKLKDAVCELVSISEENSRSVDFERLDNLGVQIIESLEELEQYRAIGTIEEFKELKEKEERFDRNIKMFNEIGLEIRNKAIDEFASALANKDNIVKHDIEELMLCSGQFDLACNYLRAYVDEIAEQMKAQ